MFTRKKEYGKLALFFSDCPYGGGTEGTGWPPTQHSTLWFGDSALASELRLSFIRRRLDATTQPRIEATQAA